MTRIFISYRRGDTGGNAGRLYDRLSEHFGEDNVFMDVDTIRPGDPFPEVIEAALGSCEVLVAVIGPGWLTATDNQGRRRLYDEGDYVRLEIAAALERDILVIPALVGGATIPLEDDLPDDLQKLRSRQALHIGNRFHPDVDRLIEVVEEKASARPRSEKRERRIDVALPSKAKVGRPVDLVVQVRPPDSPLSGIEDWPAERKPSSIEQESVPVELEFPVDSGTGTLGSAQVRIQVAAPDFEIDGAAQQIVDVPPAQDSERVFFLLTPERPGTCKIGVEVYSLDDTDSGVSPIAASAIEIIVVKPTIKDRILKLVPAPILLALGAVAVIALGVAVYAVLTLNGLVTPVPIALRDNEVSPSPIPTEVSSRETITTTTSRIPTPHVTSSSVKPTAIVEEESVTFEGDVEGVEAVSPSPSPADARIPLPVVNTFSVDPSVITQGDSVTIEWEVEGADTISIENVGDQLSLKESRTLSPTESISYVLEASNVSGQIEPIALQVFVTPAPMIAPKPAAITPTVTRTPTPELPQGEFASLKILQPENKTYGPTDFEWQWVGSKPSDIGFEVRVWRAGELPKGVHNALLDNQQGGGVIKIGENTYRLKVDISKAAGVLERSGFYSWTVVLVHIAPEYADDVGIQAEPVQLEYVGPGGPDSGGIIIN